ncbi:MULTISPECIES: hypothetical protein [unclassified Streptomyces]|uniref:hypothetical protein n=1 Tax=Streptomyces TaxID=1883 RepID=UPI001CD0F439|nr:hypothetical protein [Streptomyces sp. PSKA30]MBZ9642900.1 hypothetical protein [Streptomyces sp. PSKA30]
MNAKRILMAEAAVLGGAALALLIAEFPGIVREVRLWRMAGFRPGPGNPLRAKRA